MKGIGQLFSGIQKGIMADFQEKSCGELGVLKKILRFSERVCGGYDDGNLKELGRWLEGEGRAGEGVGRF